MPGENELFLKHRVIIETTWENYGYLGDYVWKYRIITVAGKSFALTFLCH